MKSNAGEGIVSDMCREKVWWTTNSSEVKMFNNSFKIGPVEWPVN